jgi:hypothetical protein
MKAFRIALWFMAAASAAVGGADERTDMDRDIQEVQECRTRLDATPEGQWYRERLWVGDESPTTAKLQDETSLTADERDQLLRYMLAVQTCRKVRLRMFSKWYPWAVPVFTASFSRYDEAWLRVALGEITVGECNRRLSKGDQESESDLQAAEAEARSQYAAAEEQRKAAEAAAEAQEKAKRRDELSKLSDNLRKLAEPQVTAPAAQSTHTFTSCRWVGTTLFCNSPTGTTTCTMVGNTIYCNSPSGRTSCSLVGTTMYCN